MKTRSHRFDPAYGWTPRTWSREFHNMLLRDDQLALRVRVLCSLFAEPPPTGHGPYQHHNGLQA